MESLPLTITPYCPANHGMKSAGPRDSGRSSLLGGLSVVGRVNGQLPSQAQLRPSTSSEVLKPDLLSSEPQTSRTSCPAPPGQQDAALAVVFPVPSSGPGTKDGSMTWKNEWANSAGPVERSGLGGLSL